MAVSSPSSSSASPSTTKKKPSKPNKKKAINLYLATLGVITAGFGYVVVDYFYLDPLQQIGKPVYADRLIDLKPIDSDALELFKQEVSKQEEITNLEIFPQGEIIYLNLMVDSGMPLEDAQSLATLTSETLIKQLGDSLEGYHLQMIVSSGDTHELLNLNRELELAYVKEHDIQVVEQVIAYTEEYPTSANIERSQANINLLKKSYPEEAELFQVRLNKLTPYTAEQEAHLGEIPVLVVDQIIPTSELADFPAWGVVDLEDGNIRWY